MSPRPQPGREFVLTLSCPDSAGLVHAVSGFLVRNSGNILESQQFDDRLQGRFFMRVHFDVSDPNADLETLRYRFGPVAEAYRIAWTLSEASTSPRTLIMVSKTSRSRRSSPTTGTSRAWQRRTASRATPSTSATPSSPTSRARARTSRPTPAA